MIIYIILFLHLDLSILIYYHNYNHTDIFNINLDHFLTYKLTLRANSLQPPIEAIIQYFIDIRNFFILFY